MKAALAMQGESVLSGKCRGAKRIKRRQKAAEGAEKSSTDRDGAKKRRRQALLALPIGVFHLVQIGKRGFCWLLAF